MDQSAVGRSSGRRQGVVRIVGGALAGLAIWASFPPVGLWWAAPIGTAGLALAVRGSGKRMAATVGFCCGLGLLVPLMSFVRIFGDDAWLAVAAGESLFFAGLGLLLRPLHRLSWWPIATAAGWVVQEAIRDRVPFGGFPWGRLADAQAGGPIGRLAAVGGAPLVTFAVALIGGLLALLALHLHRHRRDLSTALRPAVTASALVAAATVVGLLVPLPTAGTTAHGPAQERIAVVQGNVPRLGLSAFAQDYAVTADHERETLRLARLVAAGRLQRPAAVIWPENSVDLDPLTDPRTAEMIRTAARAVGVPILVGAVLTAPDDHLRNTGIVWSPTAGPGATYVKQHLLPFGEYLPFRPELSKLIGRFSLLSRDFLPGHRPGVLPLAGARIADVICFEVADDAVVRAAVRGGGRLLVEQTNDASFEQPGADGASGESAQQLQIARLRAIEHGRAVLVASTSGVSAAIAPNGDVLARTGVFTPALIDLTVPLRDPLTLADKVGVWPEIALCVLGAVALGLALRRRRTPGAEGRPTRPSAGDRVPAAV